MSASGWQIFVEVPGRAPIELEPGEAVIGRSRSCVVQIAESTVSRQHAVFVVEPGNVRLKDLGSSNGTYVNGKRVEGSIGLGDGDKVVIGEAELVVRILAPLGPAEATQRLVLPPMSAPLGETPGTRPTAAEPPVSFRRTPTAVPGPIDPGAPPLPPTLQAPPPLPSPPPPVVAARSVAPAPARKEAAGLAPPGGGELLGSIQEIDKVPALPAARRAPAAERVELAGFWIRVAAALLDSIPFVVLMVVGVALAFLVSPKLMFLIYPLYFGYAIFLALVMPALQGTTPGKKFLKLAIVSDTTVAGQGLGWNTALLRLVGHIVCSFTFSLGYLLVAFTAQKQGLHDLIAKTRVVRRK